MSKYFEKLKPYLEKGMALNAALMLFEWDTETQAPIEGNEYSSKAVGILSSEFFKAYTNEEVKKLVAKGKGELEKNQLTQQESFLLKELSKTIEKLEKIPLDEYRAYSECKAKAGGIWAKAKESNRYDDFAPVLKEMIDYQKKFASYQRKGKEPLYNILLDEFEPGFYIKELDLFFEKIKKELAPLIKKVAEKQDEIDKSYNEKSYDIEKQREFSRYLAGYVGFDFNRGVIGESAHPFTTGLNNHDVRMTNHYYENNLESGIFSMIHESGHALYEMGIQDDLTQTLVGVGASMGVHESQSRFYENMIGKSKEFWMPLYKKLVETFPEQLKFLPLDQFIQGINKSTPGPIRTEADELTYPMHILIRYELEKMIFENQISVEELPKEWNKKYKEYLGIEPENDTKGILQDVHWSVGSFGYFPSYVIGSAVAAQIYAHMESIMPLKKYLEEGNLTPIREYLRDKIHKYGKTKNTNELLKNMMNEEFNPNYYIDYLKDKYTKLYKL